MKGGGALSYSQVNLFRPAVWEDNPGEDRDKITDLNQADTPVFFTAARRFFLHSFLPSTHATLHITGFCLL